MPEWELRFAPELLGELARRYHDSNEPKAVKVSAQARKQGYLDRSQFLTLCNWKSPRILHHAVKNTDEEIREITSLALRSSSERIRIGSLRILQGVDWPMSSVLLHFCHTAPYPILDFRALWSLGFTKIPAHSFSVWCRYVDTCRKLSDQNKIDMRALDRALWQYSKENG